MHWAPVIFDFKSFHLLGFLVFWAVSPPLYQKAMKTYAPTKGPSLVHRLAAKPNFRHITDTNLSSRIKQCWHHWLLFDLYYTTRPSIELHRGGSFHRLSTVEIDFLSVDLIIHLYIFRIQSLQIMLIIYVCLFLKSWKNRLLWWKKGDKLESKPILLSHETID